MSVSLLQPSFFMSKKRSYTQILIGSQLLITVMAIHSSLRVAPPDLQQGGNSCIPYFLVPINKTSPFSLLFRTRTEIGAFSTLLTLVTGGFRERPMWCTLQVWDARFTYVLILFLIYQGALHFQKFPVELAPIFIHTGLIDIPIIKTSVNWWNTSHQPESISRSGTSIHVPMPIPTLSNFANFPFSTPILFILETRLPIPSFLKSPFTEEIEAREGRKKQT
ncbi:hypothetical protein IEQ34_000193 [Dendrobium chrysotoxum]|uniref:Cytochrome c assembly protein domain-containing protein n=1 Tax=Dendrobium chrysotoxum TaxID=161865 RepID=A0AAV7HQN4_DENCH|nr:hypothetical protein IEQ34_000193 [Dendrobium chrysotoxum]